MAQEQPVAVVAPTSPRKSIFASLDEGLPSRSAVILLLVTAALLAFFWLAGTIERSFLAPTATGPEAWRYPLHLPPVRVNTLIGNILIAVAVGALSGVAIRRFRWLPGPAIIAAVVFATGLGWFAYAHRGVPLSRGSGTLVHYHLHFGTEAFAQIFAALIFGAVGGVLSTRIFRRIPLSLVATGALAWVAVPLLVGAFQLVPMALISDRGYSDWDILGIAYKAAWILPFFLVAVWTAWATGGRGVWTAALIVGGVVVFQVLTGQARMITGNSLKDFLAETHWALRGLASAALGAWVAVAVLRRGRSGALARDAMIIIAIICVMAIIAGLAETLPSGLHVPNGSLLP